MRKISVFGHRSLGLRIKETDALEMRHLAVARDEQHRTGDFAFCSIGAQHFGDAAETFRREANVLGLGARQNPLRPDRADVRDQGQGDQQP